MIFVVVKKLKAVDLEKVESVDPRKENHVDIEAIRERLSKRFGKDIDRHASSIAAAAPTGNNNNEDLRTLKQKLSEKFKRFQVPTLCGVRKRTITTFRPREITD